MMGPEHEENCRRPDCDPVVDVKVRPITNLFPAESVSFGRNSLLIRTPVSFGGVRDAHIAFDRRHFLPIHARRLEGHALTIELTHDIGDAYRASISAGGAVDGSPASAYREPPLIACSLVILPAAAHSVGGKGATIELAAPLIAGEHVLLELHDRLALKAVVERRNGRRAILRFENAAGADTRTSR